MSRNNDTGLKCDLADAARFLQLLDPTATKFEFRTFADGRTRKDESLTRVFYGTLDQHAASLQQLNNRGAGVFVVVNETDGKGRENENIVRVRAVYIDLDGTPLDAVHAAKTKPHIVIQSSPGKWHVYWRVDGMALENFTLTQEALIEAFDSDPAVKGLAGVMRLPGYYHQKAEPFLVRIAETLDAPPYPASHFKLADRPPRRPVDDDIEINPDKAIAALDEMPNADVDEQDWYKIMAAAYVAGDGSEKVKQAFLRWSQRSGKHNQRRTLQRWRAFGHKPPREIRPDTLYWFADETAPGWRDRWHQKIMASVFAPLPDDTPSSPPPGSDAGPPPQQHKAAAASAAPDSNADPVDLWGKFDPPELPTGLLPVVIERYARIEGANMGCDPAGLAMSALTVCAAAITDTIKLQPKEHDELWTEAARIWAALVGHPSTKKTPTLNQAAWPAAKLDRKMIAQYLEEKETYDALSAADKKRGPPPRQSRLKVEDTTVEAAQEVLKDSPAGVLCLQDELSGFFGAIDKYAGGRGSSADRAFWMKAYNGGPSTFHRISRGSGLIPNLSVCLLGGIQPDAIRKVAADTLDDGLLQRMLFIVLRPATAGQDKPRDPVVNDYFKLVDKLHRMEPPQQPGFNDNMTEDTVLRFDQGAQEIRNQLVNRHIDLVSAIESVNNKLATHVGKYDGVFARLCVLWHCIENADLTNPPAVVTEDTARRVATFLHDFIFRHAATFYFGTLGLADNHDRLANVAGFILARELDRITNRDVQRGDRSMRKLTDWDTLKLFEQLEALGWVERRLPKRAPEKMQWIVNPQVHVRFADRAKREADRRADAREALAGVFAVQKG